MAAGFRDLLAFLLGWKSAAAAQSVAGPYRVMLGQVAQVGSVRSQLFVPGASAGQTFLTGHVVGTTHA